MADEWSQFPDADQYDGQIEPGNIDLNKRSPNFEGLEAFSPIEVNVRGRHVVIPTVSSEGRVMNPADAISQYEATGKHLGVFSNGEAATSYLEGLNNDMSEADAYLNTDKAKAFFASNPKADVSDYNNFLQDEDPQPQQAYTDPEANPALKQFTGEQPSYEPPPPNTLPTEPFNFAQRNWRFADNGTAPAAADDPFAQFPDAGKPVPREEIRAAPSLGSALQKLFSGDFSGAGREAKDIAMFSATAQPGATEEAALKQRAERGGGFPTYHPEITPEDLAATTPAGVLTRYAKRGVGAASDIIAGLVTPENAALALGTGGIANAGKIGVGLTRGIAGLFSAQATKGAIGSEIRAATLPEGSPEREAAHFQTISDAAIATLAGLGAVHPTALKTAMDKILSERPGPQELIAPEPIQATEAISPELTQEASVVQPTEAPTAPVPAFERIATAQRDLRTAKANGDAAGEAKAMQDISDISAELIGEQTTQREQAQREVVSNPDINPERTPTDTTVFDVTDTEMAKSAAESLGYRYDGVQGDNAVNITNPTTGDTFTMESGSTVADLKSKVEANAVKRAEGAPVETVQEPALASVGPGAASAAEPLASYEKRRFGERFQQDENISPEIREQTANRYYEPISNKVTVSEAENIIEKRGTDESIRLVRDEEFPMEPRVRVTMGEALIKKLNQSNEEARTMGNEVHADEFLQQAVDTAEYLSGYGTTLGQGVQAFAIWNKVTPEGRLLEATRIAKKSGVELTPEQTKRINELNAEIEKAPEGFQKDEKTQDLLSYMADIKGINPADVPIALWYSNILSGFTTQLINTIDTGLNVFSESVAAAASHPAAIPDIVSGLYQGMIKGGFEAASTLKTGRSASGDKLTQQRVLERVKFGQEGGVPLNTSTPIGRFMKRAFESKVATPLNLWKYPLRAMVASDTMFFNSMKEARARIMARALAKNEGLSGDALFKRVEDVLNQSPETLDSALKQAQDEGLTGLQQRRRVQEIVEQGRSDELVDSATEAAQIATYNHDPSGVLGLIAHNIANITQEFPLAKAIVPFTRIVANVTNRGLNYTPWGYKRLFFGEWGGKKFGSEPPVSEAYRTQLVKATLGTTAMTALALLDANDTVQVTASGPSNVDEKRQLQNTGWKPYSVKIGDTYYSYQYTPMNLGFAMVGHYRDAIRYNKLSEKDATTRLAYGMMKSGSTIFDMSFLSGVSDFIETIQGTTSSTKGAGRLFARTASSVAIPNLVKQIDKLFDPTIYQADTITQGLIRETPIARSTTLKPMLNVLGEKIQPSQNRFFTFDTKDPVWEMIVSKQAWVPVPSKTTKIKDRPISPDEYYQLIEESGPLIRDYIESNLGRLNDMTGEEAQDVIQKESQRIRKIVKSRF